MINIVNEDIFYFVDNFSIENDLELKDLRNYAEKNKVPIISKDVAGFLKVILKIIRPKNILEIGSAIGYSALLMYKASGANVFTVEKNKETYAILEENIKKYSDKIHIFNADAIEQMQCFLNDGTNFDFVFVDAAKSHYRDYFVLSDKLLSQNGVILFDNILFRGMSANDKYITKRNKTIAVKLRDFLDEIKTDDRYEKSLLTVNDGLLLLRKNEEGNCR